MKIDWDPAKAKVNFIEHSVSFGEAATVLTDDYALTREDPDAVGVRWFRWFGQPPGWNKLRTVVG